jgi:hypothetical protein
MRRIVNLMTEEAVNQADRASVMESYAGRDSSYANEDGYSVKMEARIEPL